MIFHTSSYCTFKKKVPILRQLNRIGRVLVLLIYCISFFGGAVSITQAADGISYIGEIGSAVIKTSGTSLTIVTTAEVASGDAIIIGYATDPSQTLEVSVSDAAGNTYEQAAMAISYGRGRTYIFAAYNVTTLKCHE